MAAAMRVQRCRHRRCLHRGRARAPVDGRSMPRDERQRVCLEKTMIRRGLDVKVMTMMRRAGDGLLDHREGVSMRIRAPLVVARAQSASDSGSDDGDALAGAISSSESSPSFLA